MNLLTRSVALQGLGFGVVHVALQGLVRAAVPPGPDAVTPLGGGKRRRAHNPFARSRHERERELFLILGR